MEENTERFEKRLRASPTPGGHQRQGPIVTRRRAGQGDAMNASARYPFRVPQTGAPPFSFAVPRHRAMPSTRRFTPPWSIEERQESFIVMDANGQQLAYLYFEDEPQRQMSMKRLLFGVAPGHLAGFGIDKVNAFANQQVSAS
jgi:hypothetical protein